MQRAAADHHTVDLGDVELLNVFEEGDGRLGQQDAVSRVVVDEPPDRCDVRRPGLTDLD